MSRAVVRGRCELALPLVGPEAPPRGRARSPRGCRAAARTSGPAPRMSPARVWSLGRRWRARRASGRRRPRRRGGPRPRGALRQAASSGATASSRGFEAGEARQATERLARVAHVPGLLEGRHSSRAHPSRPVSRAAAGAPPRAAAGGGRPRGRSGSCSLVSGRASHLANVAHLASLILSTPWRRPVAPAPRTRRSRPRPGCRTPRRRGLPGAAEDVEVLAAGVEDDLNLRVREHRRERGGVGRLLAIGSSRRTCRRRRPRRGTAAGGSGPPP